MPRLRSVLNFRDVGGARTREGRRVRRGVVYRSGHIGGITPEDLAILEGLPLRRVIDLRTRGDIRDDGAVALPRGAQRVHLPIGDPARAPVPLRALILGGDAEALRRHLGGGQAAQLMREATEALVVEHCETWGAMLRHLAEPGALPALVHCTAGKDRTGWAASLLLLLAGVPDEAIVAHYAESDVHRAEENARAVSGFPAGIDPDWLRPFFEARPEYARSALALLRERWGNAERYALEALRISATELAALRARLIED